MALKAPKTRRGQVSRGKILESAAELFHLRGVHATSVDDILDHASMGKSQFYHYFPSKEDLVTAVVDLQIERLMDFLQPLADRMESWSDLEQWCASYVQLAQAFKNLGCPVGVIAVDSADNEAIAVSVQKAFFRWVAMLELGLVRLRSRGVFRPDFAPHQAAEFAGTIVQGGLLLTRAFRDSAFLERANAQFLTYLKGFTVAR